MAIVSGADGQATTTFEEAISPQYSYVEVVQQTSDGGYVVGVTFSSPPYTALVAKLDSSGNLQWQKQYQSSIGSSAVYALNQTSDGSLGLGYSIVQTSDGGYMVGDNENDSPFLALALKLGSNGRVQWAKTYNVSRATSKLFSARQASDGGYVFSGQFGTGISYYYGYNAWMVKTD